MSVSLLRRLPRCTTTAATSIRTSIQLLACPLFPASNFTHTRICIRIPELHSQNYSSRSLRTPPASSPSALSPFTRPRPALQPNIKEAAVNCTALFLVGALSAALALFGSSYLSQPGSEHSLEKGEKDETYNAQSAPRSDSDLARVEHILYDNLSSFDLEAMPPYGDAPGRPGNLTPAEEQKLKEMWIALSKISAMMPEGAFTNGSNDAASTKSAETPKKKSRFGFGRSKNKDEEETSGGDNDKHGQTKDYEKALQSLTPEQLKDALWSMSKHDDPDALLLRFLRARKWDVQAALIMLVATMHWRSQEVHLDDDIMPNGERGALEWSKSSNPAEQKEGEDFLAQLRMGKSFIHGCDNDGRPCSFVRVRLHHGGDQTEKSLERFTVWTIETARMMLRPPVDTATIVFDMTDFSLANMDYTPVKFIIKCFEANYPESLGAILIYKAPWIFNQIWRIIRGWLDPVVASKVHFVANIDELDNYIRKDRAPKELGGNEDWEWKWPEPVPGEDDQMKDTAGKQKVMAERNELIKSYEDETMAWCEGKDKGEGRPRIAQRIAENYWKLDPYVRARTPYDRTGVILPGGKVDFYPKSSSDSAPAPSAEEELD
ncbi:hypothetical protein AC578_721 [Pseudocercospora eumusae]|uniref:CRAL-TRIO domain-containing protein n=1 Tax=Pseudocercospora eumusae TaxID=321146 RepID=A0A139HMW8_9PEZI|nr:hypothetical protein AC578_721 [Pseudocercospora eumusae]